MTQVINALQHGADGTREIGKKTNAARRWVWGMIPNRFSDVQQGISNAYRWTRDNGPGLFHQAVEGARPYFHSAKDWTAEHIPLERIQNASAAVAQNRVVTATTAATRTAVGATARAYRAAAPRAAFAARWTWNHLPNLGVTNGAAHAANWARDAVVPSKSTALKSGGVAVAAGAMSLVAGPLPVLAVAGSVGMLSNNRFRNWASGYLPNRSLKAIAEDAWNHPNENHKVGLIVAGAAAAVPYVGIPIAAVAAGNAIWHRDKIDARTLAKVAAGAAVGYAAASVAGVAASAAPLVAGAGMFGYKLWKNGFTAEAAKGAAISALNTAAVTAVMPTALLVPVAEAAGALAGASAVAAAAVEPHMKGSLLIPSLGKGDKKNHLVHLHENKQRPENAFSSRNVLHEIAARVNDFTNSPHPAEHLWTDPIVEKQAEYQDFVDHKLPKDVRQAARDAIHRLGDTQPKIDAIQRVFTDANVRLPAGLEIRGIIPVLEKLPTSQYLTERTKTDAELATFVTKSSTFWTLSYIHSTIPGVESSDEIEKIFQEITAEASKGNVSLKDLYLERVGKKLKFNWGKKFLARILFFLCDTLDLMRDFVREVANTVIAAFRDTVESKKSPVLHELSQKTLKRISTFLDIYHNAATSFVHDDLKKGTLADYQQKVVNGMGNDDLYLKVKRENPDASEAKIGNLLMKELCKEVTHSLIERYMPTIYPWRLLTKIPYIGKFFAAFGWFFLQLMKIPLLGYLFQAINWSVGLGFLNGKASNWAKEKLPEKVFDLVKTGLETTLPGEYAFKIGIANALTKQLRELQNDLRATDTSKPLRFTNNTKEEQDLLDGTVSRIVKALYLKKLGDNAEAEDVEKELQRLKSLDKDKDKEFNDILKELLVEGTQILIHHYTQRPEKIEELFTTILEQTNGAFDLRDNPGKEKYIATIDEMKKVTREIVEYVVRDKVEEVTKGMNEQRQKEFLHGKINEEGVLVQRGLYDIQKTQALETFTKLSRLTGEMAVQLKKADPHKDGHFLQQLHETAETLRMFAEHAKSMDIDVYKSEVQEKFDETFHPIYKDAEQLTLQTLALQKPELLFDKYHRLTAQLQFIAAHYQANELDPYEYEKVLDKMDELAGLYKNHKLEDLGEYYKNRLDGKIRELEDEKVANPAAGREIGAKIAKLKNNSAQKLLEKEIQKLKSLIERLSNVDVEANKEESIKKQIETLPANFATAVLANSKKWNTQAIKLIPIEDFAPFEEAVKVLQLRALLTPRPDLTEDKKLVDAELKKIRDKHSQALSNKIAEKKRILDEFARDAQTLNGELTELRDDLHEDIKEKLDALKLNTDQLLAKTQAIETTPVHYVAKIFGNIITNIGYNKDGKPIIEKLIGTDQNKKDSLVDAAYDLITSGTIIEGATRLLLGNVIEQDKKK